MTVQEYHRTYHQKQLHGGGGVEIFHTYIERFQHAHSPQEKMVVIDWLLHAFHREAEQRPGRPIAKNVIDLNNTSAVLQFLDGLAYGEGSEVLRVSKHEWDKKLSRTISRRLQKDRERQESTEQTDG